MMYLLYFHVIADCRLNMRDICIIIIVIIIMIIIITEAIRVMQSLLQQQHMAVFCIYN